MKNLHIYLFEEFVTMDNMPFVMAQIMDTGFFEMSKRELLDVIISLKDEIEMRKEGDPLKDRMRVELKDAQYAYEKRFGN